MMNIRDDIGKLKMLPQGSVFDRFLYVCWKLMYRRLYSRHVVETNGDVNHRNVVVPPYVQPRSNCRKLICLTGFGHSGSGAVADLLSEYQTATVLAYQDADGSMRSGGNSFEVDFIRSPAGLFRLEDYFAASYQRGGDLRVRLFIEMVIYAVRNYGGLFGSEFIRASRHFLDQLIDYKCQTTSGYDFNPFLRKLGESACKIFWGEESNYLYTLKKLTVVEYRKIAREYVQTIIKSIESNEHLVLDQVVTDGSADLSKYQDYLGPLKLIAVMRDPRDVYVTGRKLNENWIPCEVDAFIKWYQNGIANYWSLSDLNFKLIRFETLVRQYDAAVAEIEEFVGLKSSDHVNRRSAFDPQRSNKNIGIFKSWAYQEEIKAIEKHLSKFCFGEI